MKTAKRCFKKQWLLLSAGCTLIAAVTSSCGASKSDDEASGQAPASTVPGESNFAVLINSVAQAKVTPQPWAGFWWPEQDNGIASGKYGGGGSPAGKFDAAHGHKTNAQAWEVANHGTGQKRNIQGWEGHCNGWSVAAALYPEPRQPSKVNGIEFSVSDIKGLLTEAGMNASADYFGEAMKDSNYDSPAYKDTVPDQYFLVLTNYIGRRGQAVLIDRVTDYEKWNQPLAGYKIEYPKKSDYLGATPEAPGVYRIKVNSTIWWMNDNVMGDEPSPPFNYEETPDQTIQSRYLQMEVWLDGPVVFDDSGKIVSSGNLIVTRDPQHPTYFVGGTWLMEGSGMDGWPDYMWVPFSILPPNPENANPDVDIKWLETHLLPPGGLDDPTYTGGTVENAPPPRPSHSPSPSPDNSHGPNPQPQPIPNPNPNPHPNPQPFPPGPGPGPQPPLPPGPGPQPPGPGPMPPGPGPQPPGPGPGPGGPGPGGPGPAGPGPAGPGPQPPAPQPSRP